VYTFSVLSSIRFSAQTLSHILPIYATCFAHIISLGLTIVIIFISQQVYDYLYDLYLSPNIIRGEKIKKEMGGACGTYGGEERCILGLEGEISEKETTW